MPAARKSASKSTAEPASRAVVKATSRAVAKQPSRAVVKATTRAVTTASKASRAVAKVPSRAVVQATTRAMTTTSKASRAVAKPATTPGAKPAGGGKMPKACPELIARLDAAMETLPAYRRPMFGTVAWFLDANAQMFAGVWGEDINVRVGVEEAARLIASNTAREFAPMPGRPMREYVLLDASTLRAADLRKWLQRAADFTSTLAAKKGK